MATFIQRKNGWLAQVRRKGHKSISRTFNTKAEAERWAFKVESDIGVGVYVDNREAMSTTLAECLDRYEREILPDKKGRVQDLSRVKLWRSSDMAGRAVGKIKQADIASWRDARIASGLSAATVSKDLGLLSHVFTVAIKDWGFPIDNPVLKIRKPKIKNARDRRLNAGEEKILLEHCHSDEMRAFIILAIETAMRRGEIVSIQRDWIRNRVVHLPDTKNGERRNVPLSKRAVAVIEGMPKNEDGRLFKYGADAYTRGFIKACKSAGIHDLTLHDLRHEATSRLFEKGLDVMQVKSITGHKTLQMLNRYTHLRASDLVDLLG